MTVDTTEDFSTAIDRIEEEQEEIDEALQDLLIFPTQDVLRRVVQLLERHFVQEETFVKDWSIPTKDRLIQDQQSILKLATKCGYVPPIPPPSAEDCS